MSNRGRKEACQPGNGRLRWERIATLWYLRNYFSRKADLFYATQEWTRTGEQSFKDPDFNATWKELSNNWRSILVECVIPLKELILRPLSEVWGIFSLLLKISGEWCWSTHSFFFSPLRFTFSWFFFFYHHLTSEIMFLIN